MPSDTLEVRLSRLSVEVRPEFSVAYDVDEQIDVMKYLVEHNLLTGASLEDVVRYTVNARLHRKRKSDPAWNSLSATSFARDWESVEDQVYDDLS